MRTSHKQEVVEETMQAKERENEDKVEDQPDEGATSKDSSLPTGRHIAFQTPQGEFKHWVIVASWPSTDLERLLNMAFHLGYTVEQLNARECHGYDVILRRVGG